MSDQPRVELWARNPRDYVREALSCNVFNFAWDYGYLRKHKVDLERWSGLYIPPYQEYRHLVVGTPSQGCQEVTRGYTFNKPKVTHEVWRYGMTMDSLFKAVEKARDTTDSRVVITDLPSMASYAGKSFITWAVDIQEDNPDVILHLHAIYSFRVMFGLNIRSVDFDPYEWA